jgi:hypothetical protein
MTRNETGTIVEQTIVPHTAFMEAERRLTQVYAFATKKGEAEGLPIIGESGTGKTSQLENFFAKYPPTENQDGKIVPVLLTAVPSKPTVKSLAFRMLDDLGVPDPERGTEEEKTRRLRVLIKELGTRVVMFDEFHHFVDQGTLKVMHHVADWLKTLIDKTKVTVVIAGLPSSMSVIDQNVQLARRFSAPIVMPRFDWHMQRDRQQFRSILLGFSNALCRTYECPDLSTEEMGFRIYLATGGLMAYVVRLLRQLERNCITEGKRKLALDDFDAAHAQAVWSAERNPALPRPFDRRFHLNPSEEQFHAVRQIGTVTEPPTTNTTRNRRKFRLP